MKKSIVILFSIFILLGSFFIAPTKTNAQTPPAGTYPASGPNGGSSSGCRAGDTARRLESGPAGPNNPWICFPPGAAVPAGAHSSAEVKSAAEDVANVASNILLGPFRLILGYIGDILLRLGAFFLILTGLLFNWVLKFTIVDMSVGLSDVNGIGGALNSAWATLRDLANIVFIFVLLWAAIQTILELNANNFGKTIRNIIIVALLINFSLFFGKVIIDASNIATIGFYNSIIAGAGAPLPIVSGSGSGGTVSLGEVGDFAGIFMKSAGLQSFFGNNIFAGAATNALEGGTVFITGLMGMIAMLVMAVVLLVSSVMFISRYILLIFILILSPVAFVGYAVPGMSSHFKNWWSQLINQAFFAPVFMVMIWVAMKLVAPLSSNPTMAHAEFSEIATNPQGIMGIILKYVLIIGFIVGALIISKKIASKTQGFTAISGGVGAVAVGGAAMAGRRFIGANAAAAAEANKKEWSKTKSGRAKLWLADKAGSSSFDVRGLGNTAAGKAVGAKAIFEGVGEAGGKGGFRDAAKKRAEEKAKYAERVYGQTEDEKKTDEDKKKALENDYKTKKEREESEIKRQRQVDSEKAEASVEEYEHEKTSDQRERLERLRQERRQKERELDQARTDGDGHAAASLQEEIETINNSMKNEQDDINAVVDGLKKNDTSYRLLTERAKHASELAKKKEINESEYSQIVKDAKTAVDGYQNSGQKRMGEYAERLVNNPVTKAAAVVTNSLAGTIAGKPVKAFVNTVAAGSIQQGKRSAAEVRKKIKGKSANDLIAEQLRKEKEEADAATAAASTPSTTAGTGSGATPTP